MDFPSSICSGLHYSISDVGLGSIFRVGSLICSYVASTCKIARKILGENNGRKRKKDEGHIGDIKNYEDLKIAGLGDKISSEARNLRQAEYSSLQKYVYALAITTFVSSIGPIFIIVATFGTCMLIGVPLTAWRILSALTTYGTSQGAMGMLPGLIPQIAQTNVSIDCIVAFMQEEELQHDVVEKVSKESTDFAIQIQGGIFAWNLDSSSPTIRGLDVQLERGMRVAVCETVGLGKSSLLSCILGEIPKLLGSISISGTKAYVPQSPWIQSGKIRYSLWKADGYY